MSTQSRIKPIINGPCACACQKIIDTVGNNNSATTAAHSQNNNVNLPDGDDDDDGTASFTRPDMLALHQMLQNRQWNEIQDVIRKDASVAMRIDDSPEEDIWFDEARRRKAVLEGITTSSFMNTNSALVDGDGDSQDVKGHPPSLKEKDSDVSASSPPQMQLRYWVGGNQSNTTSVDMQQKRTLLHSLCRMYFPSNEALIAQLKHNDCDGLRNLMGAVKTARMLIEASHNNLIYLDDPGKGGDDKSDGVEEKKNGSSPHCNDCPYSFYRHYCPPVFLPPVEGQQLPVRSDDQIESQAGGHSIPPVDGGEKLIQHTSVLTMTDAMGESPLHCLTGAGSCHADLIEVFLAACRQPQDESSTGHSNDRRPTVYDLLVIRNFHGCTPVHFLADCKNEEVLRLLLEKCQFHTALTDAVHPTMICDNEGDLPLHFAACNGASPSLMHTLTTELGDVQSSLVRNSLGRLAVDDFIEWYMEERHDAFLDEEVSEGSDSSEIESDDDSDGSEASAASSNIVPIKRETRACLNSSSNVGDPNHFVSRNFGFLFGMIDQESKLWDPLWVLVQAAATAIRNSAYDCQQTTNREETQMQNSNTEWLPIHAAVIATEYANFPALTVAASILRNGDRDIVGVDGPGRNCFSPKLASLLQEDSYGYLPLHWACGGSITSFLPSHATRNVERGEQRNVCNSNTSTELNEANHSPLNPSTLKCKALVRWNTKELPCSMIEYLLHCEPSAARIPTREGRLPLHVLVENGDSFNRVHMLRRNEKGNGDNAFIGQPWDDIVAMLREYPDALGIPDETSQLYPFQVAAAPADRPTLNLAAQACIVEPHSELLSLENIYRLIMEDPSLLCQIIEVEE